MQWLRLYADTINNRKAQALDGETFKGWINLLCLAKQNDGKLPSYEDISFALRIDVIAARSLVDRLVIATLFDRVKGGPNGYTIAPHDWDKYQYKSDTSTERVKRFRNGDGNVSETPPEQKQKQNRPPTPKDPPDEPPKKARGKYRFEGKIIKLNQRDFDQWEKSYHAIPDLEVELLGLDAWLLKQDDATRKDWFDRTSRNLGRKHQEWLVKAKQDAKPKSSGSGVDDAYLDYMARQMALEDRQNQGEKSI